jgi:hypothetical protein
MTEPKPPFVLPTYEQQREAFDGYAVAVGRVSLVWNYLHQTLGWLFAVIIRGDGGDAELVLAEWDSTKSDWTKRERLRAAIKTASQERWKQMPKAPDDLLWVLERADTLSDVRNDAMHALVSLHYGPETVEMTVALPARGKREKKLVDRAAKGKKLLDEFAKCQRDAYALSAFVIEATSALFMPEQREWPTQQPEQIWSEPPPAKGDKRARR